MLFNKRNGLYMSRSGWSEDQIKDTINAYFDLLSSQNRNESRNKTEIYRGLSAKHPERKAKAFESKFQNISAVLYEENLPYCDGLKPRFNYQNLLRLLVLDHLKRDTTAAKGPNENLLPKLRELKGRGVLPVVEKGSGRFGLTIENSPDIRQECDKKPDVIDIELKTKPIAVQEPHEILFLKLRELKERGFLPVVGKGSGRFGLTIENSLGIPQNSDKKPDFMGIELKTKQDNSLQTLFSRVPSRFTGCSDKRELVTKHGYYDQKRNREALYTSFNNQRDSLGFQLKAQSDRIQVLRYGTSLLEYDADTIESALLSKHSQTMYVALTSRKRNGIEECQIKSVTYCKGPSITRFLKLINSGNVFLDFTLSISGNRIKDHGFLWRIRNESLVDLYQFSGLLKW